jgi:hypothetical protein
MLDEAQIKSVALFFFFACMDERTAFESTTRTIEKCQKRIQRGLMPADDVTAVIVNYTFQFWQKWEHSPSRAQAAVSHEAGWILPEKSDFGAWQEFKRSADPDEFLAVVWSKLLKFSDQQIAQGLGVTVGTVRHRVGRGLRHLGQVREK